MHKKISLIVTVFISTAVFVTLGVAFSQSIFAVVAPPPPAITYIDPVEGPVSGGTLVTITGTGFTQDAVVLFGTTPGIIQSISDAKITVNTPPYSAGTVDITINEINGSVILTSVYTYKNLEPENICKGKKVSVCHLPPGNTQNPQDLCLPESAIPAHLDHGDYLGVCK